LRLELALAGLLLIFLGQFFLLSVNLHKTEIPSFFPAGWKLNQQQQQGRKTTGQKNNRKRKKKRQWDPGLDGLQRGGPIPLKINLPVFVPSLPKSGTTSIWQYFNCGGHRASHQWVKINETYTEQTGACIQRNINHSQPAFENCGTYDVFTDTGFANFVPSTTTGGFANYLLSSSAATTVATKCYYPSVEALEAIYEHYPNATFVMVVRNSTSWYNSMANWGEGSLLQRWKACGTLNLSATNTSPQDFMRFYDWHTDNIRRFVKAHPSLTYIEVQMESKETGAILEREIGIDSKCWAKCTPYSKFCQKIS